MATRTFRAGAIKVYAPEDTDNTIASCNSLTFTAASADLTDYLNTDGRALLSRTDSYYVILTLAGRDTTNGGITHTRSSAASAAVVLGTSSTNRGILLSVTAGAWPTNFAEAYGVGIWVKKNSGNFKLSEYGIIDPDNDWKHMITNEPEIDCMAYSETFLTAAITTANQDIYIGDREPKGMVHRLVGISQGGVTITDDAEQINYRPDTSTNYALAISRGMSVTFSVLDNDMRDIISARAGEYAAFTSGVDFQQGAMSRQAASAISTGNKPLKLIYPVDSHKAVEELWMLGALRENQQGGDAQWGKDDPPTTSYVFNTVNTDACLQSLHCVRRRKRITS